MYVKLYNQILDSSIADNRRLRHFFIDLLLCSDPDGNVVMTKTAISNRTRASLDEVEWGLTELMKPEELSFTQENEGRRIIPLDGLGYGWKIVNYKYYRDLKSAKEMREATAERVKRFRENQKEKKKGGKFGKKGSVGATSEERRVVNGVANGTVHPTTLEEIKDEYPG